MSVINFEPQEHGPGPGAIVDQALHDYMLHQKKREAYVVAFCIQPSVFSGGLWFPTRSGICSSSVSEAPVSPSTDFRQILIRCYCCKSTEKPKTTRSVSSGIHPPVNQPRGCAHTEAAASALLALLRNSFPSQSRVFAVFRSRCQAAKRDKGCTKLCSWWCARGHDYDYYDLRSKRTHAFLWHQDRRKLGSLASKTKFTPASWPLGGAVA